MSFEKSKKVRAGLFVLALGVAFLVPPQPLGASGQNRRDETRNTFSWNRTDEGVEVRLEIRGRAQFNSEYTDVREVSEGGGVRIGERRDGQSRRYETVRPAGGPLVRTYYLNGEARALDQQAQAWAARIVLEVVRESAFEADKRVQNILGQYGINGVFEEINHVSSDYAKRVYFKALLKNGSLGAAALDDLLQKAGEQITSDYEKGELLVSVAEALPGQQTPATFFKATATIRADHAHRRVLTAQLKKRQLSPDSLIQIARSAAAISSDYDKSTVLKDLSRAYVDDPKFRDVFFQAVATIRLDYAHRGVLSALLKSKAQSQELCSAMLNSAIRISSDYEKITSLREASNAWAPNEQLRPALLKIAETIKSDYERGRVLSALMKTNGSDGLST